MPPKLASETLPPVPPRGDCRPDKRRSAVHLALGFEPVVEIASMRAAPCEKQFISALSDFGG
jgi:hypothetical protein